MRLADVPHAPAYLVAHDCFDNGAMEVWPMDSLTEATETATNKQNRADEMGVDSVLYKAYEKLPRKKVWKYYAK